MSYQAISDFLINPVQIQQDFQKSKINIEPQTTQSSSSFSDLVSFYRELNEKPAESPETTDAAGIPAEKKLSDSENADVPKETENLESPKADEAVPVEEKGALTKSEKVISKDDVPESSNAGNKLRVSENAEKPAQKTDEKLMALDEKTPKTDEKDKKKLSAKDFARMEQLAGDQSAGENAAQVASNFTGELKNQLVKEEKRAENAEKIVENAIPLENAESTEMNSFVAELENQFEQNDFSQNAQPGGESRIFTLDKEGKITVEDLRTAKGSSDDFEKMVAENSENTGKKGGLRTSDIKMTDSSTALITMDVAENANADVLSLDNQTASANGSNFQAMLSNQIQSNASEFVKAGNLVLKDNNQGTINLVLHPDDLGNVKIHLSLDGKTVSGHITVTSKEALQVFKDNSETLREAFIKNGFEAAEFDVAFNNFGSSGQDMDFGSNQEQNNFVAHKVYTSVDGGAALDFEDAFGNSDEFSNYSINIVA